mmetsp:Transcript_26838/g.78768  ORF Transcript_26838/g.78768 Transcript_26838/m.78768 type:complete len:580 (+) Transcript_26838:219-1958(+)
MAAVPSRAHRQRRAARATFARAVRRGVRDHQAARRAVGGRAVQRHALGRGAAGRAAAARAVLVLPGLHRGGAASLCGGDCSGGALAALPLHPAVDARRRHRHGAQAVGGLHRAQHALPRHRARAGAPPHRFGLGPRLLPDAAAADAARGAAKDADRLVSAHALPVGRDLPHAAAPEDDLARRARREPHRLPDLRLRPPFHDCVCVGPRDGRQRREHVHFGRAAADGGHGGRLPRGNRLRALPVAARDARAQGQGHRAAAPLRREEDRAGHRPHGLHQRHPAQATRHRQVPLRPPDLGRQDPAGADRDADYAGRHGALRQAAEQGAQAGRPDQRPLLDASPRADPLPRPAHLALRRRRALLPGGRDDDHVAARGDERERLRVRGLPAAQPRSAHPLRVCRIRADARLGRHPRQPLQHRRDGARLVRGASYAGGGPRGEAPQHERVRAALHAAVLVRRFLDRADDAGGRRPRAALARAARAAAAERAARLVCKVEPPPHPARPPRHAHQLLGLQGDAPAQRQALGRPPHPRLRSGQLRGRHHRPGARARLTVARRPAGVGGGRERRLCAAGRAVDGVGLPA